MSFVSWQYPIFLLCISGVYWRLPLRGRWWLLLTASYGFYAAWDVRFLALILTSTAIDYFCGRAIVGEERPTSHILVASLLPVAWLGVCRVIFPNITVSNPAMAAAALLPLVLPLFYRVAWRYEPKRRRQAFLGFSILSNLAVLLFFKYFNFFGDTLQSLLQRGGFAVHWVLPVIFLPIAISFYTFQSISYAVDIYRGKAEPARDYVLFAAYLAFFPQLVSGPIERAGRFLPQFQSIIPWKTEHLHAGLRLLLVGLFKKIVVADNCAMVANYVFDPKTPLDAGWALLGLVAFTFQIYGDFSGYTDLARGSARLLGIELSANFRFPYFATGPSDFWRRWHITLSSWFRDYVYIPLGGNRGSTSRTLANLWITMVLAGLWHGANWTFMLWGAYHALLLTLYRWIPPLARLESANTGGARRVLAIGVMLVFTMIGWVLFRCNDLAQLAHWFGALSVWSTVGLHTLLRPAAWVLIHVTPLLLWQAATWTARDEAENHRWSWVARGLAYAMLILMIGSSAASDQEFIYFQF